MPTRQNNHTHPGNDHPGNAMAMLTEDRQRVRDIFQEYAVARDPRAQRVIAEEACTEIELHAQMEAEIFYPAVEDAIEVDRQELIENSLREHQARKDVIRELREIGPDDTPFDAKFHELQLLVAYHVAKEEAEIFLLAQEALAEDLDAMSAEMQELKKALMAS